MLYINAVNIHIGGGKAILCSLLNCVMAKKSVVAVIDTRLLCSKFMLANLVVKRVFPSVIHRFKHELWLKKNVDSDDVIFSLSNLPPLFKLRCRVVVLVHSRYLVNHDKLNGFSFKTVLRIHVERLWLSWFSSHCDEFIVQTSSMKRLLENKIGRGNDILVAPFYDNSFASARKVEQSSGKENPRYNFIYVATGEPHKNHKILIEAWCLLAKENLFPSLCLTLNDDLSASLCSFILEANDKYSMAIENVGVLSHNDILKLYGESQALIYPSRFESLGLPLIEARQVGLPVLASELDYVRDVVDPEETFDPESAISIARAVKRFMDIEEKSPSLLDAEVFIEKILGVECSEKAEGLDDSGGCST